VRWSSYRRDDFDFDFEQGMRDMAIKHGLFLPQGFTGELAEFSNPAAAWRALTASPRRPTPTDTRPAARPRTPSGCRIGPSPHRSRHPRFLLLSKSATGRAMITKDSYTYTINFLRQDKSLRDHRAEHRPAARPKWPECSRGLV
jgi:hypothetical protein